MRAGECNLINEKTVNHLNVSEVRKTLSLLRKEWENHTPVTPIMIAKPIVSKMCMSEFCFRFVMGHHEKRHKK